LKVLLRQFHGLGDAVQLTVILKHLRHYYPDWQVDVELARGKHSVAHGLCHQVWITRENPAKGHYDRIFHLVWPEANVCYDDLPSGKVTRCLYEVFNLKPLPDLFSYTITLDSHSVRTADAYLAGLPEKKGYVFIHYQGNSSSRNKNLSHDDVRCICDYLLENHYTPIILDFDHRSTLIDQRTVFCPDPALPMWKGGMGDAALIAALIARGCLFVGIDSGPLHVAGATQTPAIGIWTKHHPVNFYDLSKNVMHLIPQDARRNIRIKERDKGQKYFETHYRFKYYSDLRQRVLLEISEQLGAGVPNLNPMAHAERLQSTHFGEQYYWEHKTLGVDYASYGDWQQNYGHWLAACLGWRGKKVLDVGCACGALTKGFRDGGCIATGCDLNEYCINLGRSKWPDLPLVICDAANLHPFDAQSFEGVHLMQTLEHVRPEYVPFVLSELNRVCVQGAVLFSVHDTVELFARQNRDGEKEDPTHVCIRPRRWWHTILEATGWEECIHEFGEQLKDHALSFLQKYQWEVFCYRKIGRLNYK